MGLVFLPRPGSPGVAPILRVDRGPTVQEIATLEAALPGQPLRLAAVLAGDRELPGWWGAGRPAGWQDIIEAAREVLRVSRVPFDVRADSREPWHPGRCAAVFVQADGGREWLAGHAGELHPRVTAAFDLAPRTCALEVDMSVIETAAASLEPAQAPRISPYPVATQDVALVVPAEVPAADVEAALVAGVAGSDQPDLLEEVRLFDVYTGTQAGEGRKSLAYTLRFRAPDRTLTVDETTAARDAAVAEAARRALGVSGLGWLSASQAGHQGGRPDIDRKRRRLGDLRGATDIVADHDDIRIELASCSSWLPPGARHRHAALTGTSVQESDVRNTDTGGPHERLRRRRPDP
jgi:phenylalanyl-tRNA synthetase beta chain